MKRIAEAVLAYGSRTWIWSGCVLIILAIALYAAGFPTESGDLWIGLQNGRHATAGTWATRDPHRTWQMKALDPLGIHLTFQDPFSAKARPYRADSLSECGWINQNWLCHVLFYKMRMAFGEDSASIERGEALIVIYKYLEVIAIALLLYATARTQRAHPLLSAGAVIYGLMISLPFFDLRPNTSSFVFTAAMMLLFALWRTSPRGGTVLYGIIPVMVLWANMHGGFVYALLVFPMVCLCQGFSDCMHRRWPRYFLHLGRRKLTHLAFCTALVFVVPVVLSPFGIRNLFHPLLISVGSEAKIFRGIAEWRPLSELGANVIQPHVAFASILGAAQIVWFVAWIGFRPKTAALGRGSETPSEGAAWPKFDVAQAGVVLLTIWMAVTARRFVPLAAIASSSYLAQVLQQTAGMIGWNHATIEEWLPARGIRKLALLGATSIAIAGIWGLQHTCRHAKDLFTSCKGRDGEPISLFHWLSRIEQSPAAAAEFLNANRITGVVFNGWMDGGLLAFRQTPDPNTGQPRCKVFIDGRSQAAYDVRHYIYWRILNGIPSSDYKERYGQVEAEAQRRSLQSTDPVFLKQLITDYFQIPIGDAVDPNTRADRERYERLLNTALSCPVAFDALLREEGVNAVLMSVRQRVDYRLYLSLPNWTMVYQDDAYVLLLRRDCAENQELLRKDATELIYPNDFTRSLSVGLRYCASGDSVRRVQGVRLLMSIDRPMPRCYVSVRDFVPGVTDSVFEYGIKAGMHDEIADYLSRMVTEPEPAEGTAWEKAYAQARFDAYCELSELAVMQWDYDQARRYFEQAKAYREQCQAQTKKHNSRRL